MYIWCCPFSAVPIKNLCAPQMQNTAAVGATHLLRSHSQNSEARIYSSWEQKYNKQKYTLLRNLLYSTHSSQRQKYIAYCRKQEYILLRNRQIIFISIYRNILPLEIYSAQLSAVRSKNVFLVQRNDNREQRETCLLNIISTNLWISCSQQRSLFAGLHCSLN